MRLFVFVLTAVFSALPAPNEFTQADPNAKVIDGSTHPELFPEWFIWEQTFQRLGGDTSKHPVPLHRQLGVSEPELKLLLDEVRSFNQLEQALAKRLLEAKTSAIAQGASEDRIRDATQAVNLDYRYKVLDLRQRVYERLSPESLVRLRRGIDQGVRGTTVYLRGKAVEFFR